MASRRQSSRKSGEAGSKSGTDSRLIDSRRQEIRLQLAIFRLALRVNPAPDSWTRVIVRLPARSFKEKAV